MRRIIIPGLVSALCLLGPVCRDEAAPGAPGLGIRPVAWTRVDVSDSFWAPLQRVNQDVTLPYLFRKLEETAPLGEGLFKTLEASAYSIAHRPDPALAARVGAAFAKIAAEWLPVDGEESWDADRWSRRLYAVGHYLEAAVAWHLASGDRRVLDDAIAAADLLDGVFGPGKARTAPAHEEIEIALLRLSEVTGRERYWKLAKFFVDQRGRPEGRESYETWGQDHRPFTEQDEAVGHCVMATYLYTAAAGLAEVAADPAYEAAVDAIWADVVRGKTHLTGGLGAIRFHEQFGAAHELPNAGCWCETCAAIGSVFWNQRMFRLHGDAKYVDALERALYNGALVGVSRSGDRFFYQNVLKSFGRYPRFEWINVPCCPPNLARLIASMGEYVYATGPNDLYVNLFVGSMGRMDVAGTPVIARQETRYPWDGRVRIAVDPDRPKRFALRLRIPGWAQGRPLPSDLYTYMDGAPAAVSIAVNGAAVEPVMDKGYAIIDRRWAEDDVVELNLEMPVRRVLANENVSEDRGLVAFERGPLVYCAEAVDNGGAALNIVVPEEADFASEFKADLLGGVQAVTGEAAAVVRSVSGALRTVPRPLVLIPYYAWCNRGLGEMAVWLARSEGQVRASPIVPPSPIAGVRQFGGIELVPTGYGDQNDDLMAICDGFEPLGSADESQTYYRLRPPPGKRAWIEYAFARPTEISSARVYFVDDRRFCRLPDSWRIVAKVGRTWREVEALGSYPVETDAWCEVAFKPVVANAVVIEIRPKPIRYAAGRIGPPAALRIESDIFWRECGIIEFRVR